MSIKLTPEKKGYSCLLAYWTATDSPIGIKGYMRFSQNILNCVTIFCIWPVLWGLQRIGQKKELISRA